MLPWSKLSLCVFFKRMAKASRSFHAPWEHTSTTALCHISFGIAAPSHFSHGGFWSDQELEILFWLLVAGWPSVLRRAPCCRMVLVAQYAGGGCCHTPATLLPRSFALFPAVLWLLLRPPVARAMALMWLQIALRKGVQTEQIMLFPAEHL